MTALPGTGAIGLGWRDATAWLCATSPRVAFVELIAERLGDRELPAAVGELIARGVAVLPHGVSLGLADATPPAPRRLRRLARAARSLGAPLVSEHVAFVRGGGREVEHLLPPPRTPAVLELLVDNVRRARDALPVPLALENIAPLFVWPDPGQMSEAEFLAALSERTGCPVLLDLSNLHAAAHNHGVDAHAVLRALPPARVAYLHVAGGEVVAGVYHDTHAHPVAAPALALLEAYRELHGAVPPVLLERDARFGEAGDLEAELAAIAAVVGETEVRDGA